LPGQVFFFTMFLHFTTILFVLPSMNKVTNYMGITKIEKKKIMERYDSLSHQFIIDTTLNEAFRDSLFPGANTNSGGSINLLTGLERMKSYNIKESEIYDKSVDQIIEDHNITNY